MKILTLADGAPNDRLQQCLYNGVDSMVTLEIADNLRGQLNPANTKLSYEFSRSLLGPALYMMRRGIRIDDDQRTRLVNGDPNSGDRLLHLGLKGRIVALSGLAKVLVGKKVKKEKWAVVEENSLIQRLAKVIWDKPLNIHSDKQLKEIFYVALKIPKIFITKKGEKKLSCSREALEKISKRYIRARPLADAIARCRDLEKQCEVLTNSLSPEGRWTAGYNIGGTETGRWSSSSHPMGHSSNVQNIDPTLRRCFVADPGRVLINTDLQGAESRAVAYLSGDPAYIRAVESGDIHTTVAAMVWGFEPTTDNSERKFYRDYTYRFMCKKLGHGSNYNGMAKTLAAQTRIPIDLVKDFQEKYFKTFPRIRMWQQDVIRRIQTKGYLVTPFGFKRTFWGRPDDESTWREAIAFEPQSIIGQLTKKFLYTLWSNGYDILADGHDAVLWQLRLEEVASKYPQAMSLMRIEFPIIDISGVTRTVHIPIDAQAGMNWAKFDRKDPSYNPTGLGSFALPQL